jgi:hypothetical protein
VLAELRMVALPAERTAKSMRLFHIPTLHEVMRKGSLEPVRKVPLQVDTLQSSRADMP